MSYPLNDNHNTKWEPPQVESLVLPPRRRSIIREEQPDGKFEEKTAPLERWTQPSLCPCQNPTIMLYSLTCCCCAMGDIGCIMHEKWYCYPAYCMCASCPCCVGDTREQVAEKYNLPISEWEPNDCGWCIVKLIGTRLMCFASVCLLPCFHIAQMRAEVAFRKHGAPTVCPCCCCWCGGGNGPGKSVKEGDKLDYPRDSEQDRKPVEEQVIDYPRAVPKKKEADPEKKAEDMVLDYPVAGDLKLGLGGEEDMKIMADYPKADESTLYPLRRRRDMMGPNYSFARRSDEYAPPLADYPRSGGTSRFALGSRDFATSMTDNPHAGTGAMSSSQYALGSREFATSMIDYPPAGTGASSSSQYALGSREYGPSVFDYPQTGGPSSNYSLGSQEYAPPVSSYQRRPDGASQYPLGYEEFPPHAANYPH